MQHFRLSFFITIILLALAAAWGFHTHGINGMASAMLTVGILGVMEVSLSFDNAVVNASVLRTWGPFWQKMFLTVGIIVAVFGMRLLFPLLIVAIATSKSLPEVWSLALNQPAEYSRHLNANHAEVAAFGGAFLLLVFLNFLFDDQKKLHWLGWVEEKLGQHGTEGLAVLLALLAVFGCVSLIPEAHKLPSLTGGMLGVAVYVGVKFLGELLEEKPEPEHATSPATSANNSTTTGTATTAATATTVIMRGSIGGFIYLEILDASFSFDGVIGAFAISSDVVIIMLGLAIGAAFVRSLTVFLVNRGTLDEFVFLEHGAHYAIGILALIMLIGVKYPVPEWFTGLSGVAFILASLWSSVHYKKQAL